MAKKSCLRTFMDSQHVKGSKRLLKSAPHYFCDIFWSLWKEISSKNFLLVVSEILRLFVKILTPDDKYSLSVKATVYCNKSQYNSLKIKKYFLKSVCICAIYRNLALLSKKRSSSEVISFWNYRLQNMDLITCPKSPLLEHLWRVNMLKGLKNCLNLHGSVFVLLFHQSESESPLKCLF